MLMYRVPLLLHRCMLLSVSEVDMPVDFGVMMTSSVILLPFSTRHFLSSLQTAPCGFVISLAMRENFIKSQIEPLSPLAFTVELFIMSVSPSSPSYPDIPHRPVISTLQSLIVTVEFIYMPECFSLYTDRLPVPVIKRLI